jgi:hypothetical protein
MKVKISKARVPNNTYTDKETGLFTPTAELINYIFQREYPNHLRRFDKITDDQAERVLTFLKVFVPDVQFTVSGIATQLWYVFGAPRSSSEGIRPAYETKERQILNSKIVK